MDTNTTTLTEKRKRETRDSLEKENPFAKSHRIRHSPKKTEEGEKEVAEMEELKSMMKQMMEDIKEIKKENKKIKEEFQESRGEFKEKEKKWETERTELGERIGEMERQEEVRERKERRKNIVITGVEWKEHHMSKEVEEWLKREIGVVVGVEVAYKVRERKMIVVKLKGAEEKRKIMEKKRKLRERQGERVYIDDDLTKKERAIQKKIREEAVKIRREGKIARVGYKKITVEGKMYKWSEEADKLEYQGKF